MQQEKFSYATQPHAAPVKGGAKAKYRDENEQQLDNPSNIMHDARVIRGNTYSAKQGDLSQSKEPGRKGPRAGKDRKFIGKRASSPAPVDGRVHGGMQTDDFLEELTDRPIEVDVETQTLQFMDRPPSPLFVRAVTGRDADTQILPGDLFNFDLEVGPILEVLVGKTIHLSMLELVQEEELEAIRLQQEEFAAIRNIELAEVQRLEAEARRKAQEKERRIAQEKQRVEDRKKLDEKIAARAFSRQYLGSLHTSVFEDLQSEGIFYDPVEKEVTDIFLATTISSLAVKFESYEVARSMADELLEAVRERVKIFEALAIRLRDEMFAKLETERLAKIEDERLALEETAKLAAAALADGTSPDE